MAETYHILNYRELSPELVATLLLGLRDDSRVKRKISENKITLDQMLLSMVVDDLNFIAWSKTKAGQKNQNKPESLYKKLMGLDEKANDDLMIFETPEEYEQYMKEKREGWQHG